MSSTPLSNGMPCSPVASPPEQALQLLSADRLKYHIDVRNALNHQQFAGVAASHSLMEIESIETGMVIAQDVFTRDNILLVPKGYTVSEAVLRRLHNFKLQQQIPGALLVLRNL